MTERLTELDILNSISDKKSLDIFCSIAKGVAEGSRLQTTLGLSRKQYYSRTERMLKAGLIRRKKGSVFSNRIGHYCISYANPIRMCT